MARRARGRDERNRLKAQMVGAVGVIGAAILPIALWHDVISMIVGEYELSIRYLLTAAMPWILMVLGLLCAIPLAVTELRDRERRFHRNSGRAWAGWGVTLYLLGFALASQVAQIVDLGVGYGS
jgi:heme/copper-type cytochrome/quinol oxidase subunit 1